MPMAAGDATRDVVAQAVTALFVPGDRPDRFAKAAVTGADLVILDLEDAVADDRRAQALANVVDALAAGMQAVVRVVAAGSSLHTDQVLAIAGQPSLLGVMLAKADSAADVGALSALVGAGVPLLPLIESALGVMKLDEIVRSPGVVRVAFGALDFALDVDGDDDSLLAYARAALVIASRAAGVAAPLESPNPRFRDLDAVAEGARRARARGFGGQLCIHPAQVAVVDDAFLPTAAEIEWARTIVGAGEGASAVDGGMVDRPVLERARRIARRAKI
jgi:citrate lyase subunit beta/citryl-CoA lyase